MYFWRTQQQQEIDFVEERAGEVTAYEFKWNKKKLKLPEKFIVTYNAKAYSIDRGNFREFVKIDK